MMKKILLILGAIFCIFCNSKIAFAGQPEDIDFGQESVADAVPDSAREILDEHGVTPENSGVLNFSFSDFLSGIWELICEQSAKPIRLFCSLFGVIILCALSENLSQSGQLKGVFPAVGVLGCAGIAAAEVSNLLSETLSALSASANFTLIFIPVFTGISAVLGHVSTASAVNSLVLAATQLFSQLAVNFLAPLSGAILGLSAAGAAHPQLKLDKLGEAVKKFIVWGLTLIMTVFMSVLSAQTLVAASSDNTAIKTAKFMVSQGVPIVGGTISDAVNTLSGGISMLKSSVGAYGVVAAAAIMLPAVVRISLYRLSLFCAQSVSEMFGQKPLATLFKSCCSVVTIILAVTVCFLLLGTLAVLLMLAVTGTV